MRRAVGGAAFLFFMVIGNFLGKVRRNFYIGVRTPWTLVDERVWYATHRFTAKLWTAGSALCFILVLASQPSWTWLSGSAALAIAPIAYSFIAYKRREHLGQI
jgi:uncharacterized membrane protein